MTTKLQKWGNSQGIRLPKGLLTELGLENGAAVEVQISPGKDAIIVRAAEKARSVRGRHRLGDLVAKMPRAYRAHEFQWGKNGREVW